MRYRLIAILISFSALYHLRAQDSIAFTKDFRLYEGLYLGYQDFRYNWPIPKEKIITKINKDQLDFYSKLIEEEFIEYTERDGSITKMKSNLSKSDSLNCLPLKFEMSTPNCFAVLMALVSGASPT